MSADNDIPDVPFPYTKILVFDALLDLAAYNGQMDNGRIGLWTKRIQDLEAQMFMNSDPSIVGATSRSVRVTGDFED
jgi:hypothetical protein